jgi:geranylgeranyl reductase family protein
MTEMATASLVRGNSPIGEKLWDVLIVGAGPAGATAAAHIASAGHAVLLIDKCEFPREKACGDALIPDALNSLKSLGLYETVRMRGHSVDRLVIISPSGIKVCVPTECVTLKRVYLDQLIVNAAVDRGATLVAGSVANIFQEPNRHVTAALDDSNTRVRARIGVIATGANVSLLQDLDMLRRPKASGTALRCYVKSPVDLDHMVVSYQRSISPGYAWIFPMGEHEYNVGCGVFYTRDSHRKTNLREVFNKFVTRAAVAKPLMDSAESVTPLRGARLRSGLEGAAFCNGGSIVAIGETAGATYPFTGEGIGKAMESGAVAARQICEALKDNDLSPIHSLPLLFEKELAPRYSGYRVAQRWLSKPWLSDLMAARIVRSRRLQQATAGIINETADPRMLFSWRTLLPDWVRGDDENWMS